MDFEVRHVRRKQLNTYLDKDILNVERKKRDANASNKRAATEAIASSTNQTETQTEPPENESPESTKQQKV